MEYQDYTDAGVLDGTEILVIVRNPSDPARVTRKTTTAAIALLAGTPAAVILAGSTAGHAYITPLSTGTNYKEYAIVLVGWQDNGQTYVWPTAFTDVAVDVETVTPSPTVSLANIIFADNHLGAAINGIITVKGR